jgi:hypothetical protein
MFESWAWLKRYRVWEAVRKVFLYAENWLQPERPDDQSASKTPLGDKKTSLSDEPPKRSD